MKPVLKNTSLGSLLMVLLFATGVHAQQNNSSVQKSTEHTTQAPGGAVTSPVLGIAAGSAPAQSAANGYGKFTSMTPGREAQPVRTSTDNNPFDPLLEPPPLPKGTPTLIGGLAVRVDQVRNHLTVQPFGGGAKVKVFVDERSHIYRDGTETTVLGIHKGDRVYVDTMLDGSQVFAKNVRVVTQMGTAQMRGQVVRFNLEKGIIVVRDQLSVKPVEFAIGAGTIYNSSNGTTIAGDLQPGSLVDVQFTLDRNDHYPLAQKVVVLAKPGDMYLFAGVVLNLDMRTGSLVLQNQSDQEVYELRFNRSALSDPHALKAGSEVRAQTVFNGKEYKVNEIQVENTSLEQDSQPQVQ